MFAALLVLGLESAAAFTHGAACMPTSHQTRCGEPVANLAPRRAVLAGAACLLVPGVAHASYALGAAHETSHTWAATDKAKELAVYEAIKNDIDAKRPNRPEVGERAPPSFQSPSSAASIRARTSSVTVCSALPEKAASAHNTTGVSVLARTITIKARF